MRTFAALVICCATAASVWLGLDSASSQSEAVFWLLLLIVAAVLLLPTWLALVRYLRQRAPSRISARAFILLLIIACGLGFGVPYWFLHPRNIRYTFDYGQSGSWQGVQFSVFHRGSWIEGPWAGGYPVSVSFPDLDGDGHPDIRVTSKHRGVVEFIYLPDATEGPVFRMSHRDELLVRYPAAHIQIGW